MAAWANGLVQISAMVSSVAAKFATTVVVVGVNDTKDPGVVAPPQAIGPVRS